MRLSPTISAPASLVSRTLTERDLEMFAAEYATEVAPSVADETYDGPLLVMASVGYCEIWSDGSVTQYGVEIARVETID